MATSLLSRRQFNEKLTKGLGATALAATLPLACTTAGSASNSKKKLGIALVGLGEYSTSELAPSLQETEHCHLAGIVTGTPRKEKIWADKYGIQEKNIYNYDTFDQIADNPDIDVVYVVLPNAMHAEFTIRAAKAGKHVICEKPMAISVKECQSMIQACKNAGVKLGIGYRLHSEPYTQQIKQFVAEETFGKPRFISAGAGYLTGNNWDQWRFNKALSGGGALMNMGVYAIQGALYAAGENPISISAQEFSTNPAKYKETDETVMMQMAFPSGAVANLHTTHNAHANRLYTSCDRGWFELDVAYTYGPLHGRSSQGEITFPHRRQQALQMDDFAKHVLEGTPNIAPAEMGLRDMQIVEAVYQSIAEGGKTISLEHIVKV